MGGPETPAAWQTGFSLRAPGAVVTFSSTALLAAFLLFLMQPLFAKMALPALGGADSVWAVALLFFQSALLAGYGYAHLLIRWLPARRTGFVHLLVLGIALLFLPIAAPAGWGNPPPGDPYLWQLGMFTTAVGLPFVAVAASGPLLQAWLASSGHSSGQDPYFLYAASNLGSLLALLGYPFVFEPTLGLSALGRWWTVGFIALALTLAASFRFVWLGPATKADRGAAASLRNSVPSRLDPLTPCPVWATRLRWIGLALVPSALLIAVTTQIATDVAAAPLLWVVPLSLYLLTFVFAFRERRLLPQRLLLALHLAAILSALLLLSQARLGGWGLTSAAALAALWTSALLAHRALYAQRPAAQWLTEFYLLLALGGALGGVFAALLAPRLFSDVTEYPLLLALTIACRPDALRVRDWRDGLDLWLIALAGGFLVVWGPWAAQDSGVTFGGFGVQAALVAVFSALSLTWWRHPPRQLAVAMLAFAAIALPPGGTDLGDTQRSYFGVYRSILSDDGQFELLLHGTTLHGVQRVRRGTDPSGATLTPGIYYHPRSPIAAAITAVRERTAAQGRTGRYGIVGLGVGSLACYAHPNESWRFFEIDPLVVEIATRSPRFSYLRSCQPDADVVLGDARLALTKEAPSSFDLLVIDAFSSDAVPIHLLTAEALRLYADTLRPNGILALHISNRFLDLEAVLAATLPLVPELRGLLVTDDVATGGYAASSSVVALLASKASALDVFRSLAGASEIEDRDLRPWTDDRSDILRPFLSRGREARGHSLASDAGPAR